MLLPLHMSSLTSQQFREEILSELKLLPERAKRRLILLIKELDDDVPQTFCTIALPIFLRFVLGLLVLFLALSPERSSYRGRD